MTKNPFATVLSAVLVLLVITLTATAYAKGASDARADAISLRDATVSVCEWTENFNSDSGAMLRSSGWEGYPFDSAERLYSPACYVTTEGNRVIVQENYTTVATFPVAMTVMPE